MYNLQKFTDSIKTNNSNYSSIILGSKHNTIKHYQNIHDSS